jgi:hypothetical protein
MGSRGVGEGEMGRWGDGEMGRWGDGEGESGIILIMIRINLKSGSIR